MNNKLKFLSILLAMLMVLSSVAAVFAEGETAPQATDDGTEPTEVVTDGNEGDGTGDGTEPTDVVEPGTEPIDVVEPGTEPIDVVEPGTEPAESVEPETQTPEEGVQDPEGFAPEAPLAGEKVSITITCKYKNDSAVLKTVKGEYAVGDEVKAPAVECATSPDRATFVVEEGVTEYVINYTPTAPKKVTEFKLHPSYKSIILTWNDVPGAEEYRIYRSKDNKNFSRIKTITDKSDKSKKFIDTNAKGTTGDFKLARKYYYKIAAVNVVGEKSYISEKTASLGNTCIRPMYEQVTFKSSAQLTSHDGKSKTRTFHGGQTIIAQGFGGGKYKFWYKGNYFYASYVRVKNCKAKYQKNEDGTVGKAYHYTGKWAKQDYAQDGSDSYKGIKYYDKLSAENFVNKSKEKSKTKYLIWVSTYQQHLYVFKGSKGKWKLVKDWECSTGAAKSPTPTGFGKKIHEQRYFYSQIHYWSMFQHANSIHGTKNSKYRFGRPMSNGCVRNFDENAKWLYKKCDVGTGVIIY